METSNFGNLLGQLPSKYVSKVFFKSILTLSSKKCFHPSILKTMENMNSTAESNQSLSFISSSFKSLDWRRKLKSSKRSIVWQSIWRFIQSEPNALRFKLISFLWYRSSWTLLWKYQGGISRTLCDRNRQNSKSVATLNKSRVQSKTTTFRKRRGLKRFFSIQKSNPRMIMNLIY